MTRVHWMLIVLLGCTSAIGCGPKEGGPAHAKTCDDGERNGDEEGVDCGGPCDPCDAEATCSDGERNGDEEGIDCGGQCDPCDAEATCSDGEQNGDEEGVDCGGGCDPCRDCAPGASRVFQTSQFYTADFAAEGGKPDALAGADALCQARAMEAGLGGEWKAWLSTATVSARSRIEDAGPWYRVDRCTLVAPDLNSLLMDGPKVSISYDEFGESFDEREDDFPYAWTGTDARGMATFDHCESWTSTDFTIGATAGEGDNSNLFDGGWTAGSNIPCDQWGRLYCFEQ